MKILITGAYGEDQCRRQYKFSESGGRNRREVRFLQLGPGLCRQCEARPARGRRTADSGKRICCTETPCRRALYGSLPKYGQPAFKLDVCDGYYAERTRTSDGLTARGDPGRNEDDQLAGLRPTRDHGCGRSCKESALSFEFARRSL